MVITISGNQRSSPLTMDGLYNRRYQSSDAGLGTNPSGTKVFSYNI